MGYSTYQGKVKLVNEDKYVGDPSNVVYRSSWERFFSVYLDMNDNVTKWGSEEIVIPYFYPVDGKTHRYFPDYFIEFKNGKKLIVEIKPFKETQEPVLKKGGNKKTYADALATYIKNCAKWEAAKEFCDDRGWSFRVFTENELARLKTGR